MSHGIRIYNSSGFLQLDDNHKVFAVQSIGAADRYTVQDYGLIGKIEFLEINGNYVNEGALAVIVGTTDKKIPYLYYNAATNITGMIAPERRYDTFARLKNGPVSSASPYGIRVNNGSSQILFNSSDRFFCATQEVVITVSTSTKSVTVPINFGDYPSTSNVWLLCAMGPSSGVGIRVASSSYIYSADPLVRRSGNSLICTVQVSGIGNSPQYSILPYSATFTFLIGIIP